MPIINGTIRPRAVHAALTTIHSVDAEACLWLNTNTDIFINACLHEDGHVEIFETEGFSGPRTSTAAEYFPNLDAFATTYGV